MPYQTLMLHRSCHDRSRVDALHLKRVSRDDELADADLTVAREGMILLRTLSHFGCCSGSTYIVQYSRQLHDFTQDWEPHECGTGSTSFWFWFKVSMPFILEDEMAVVFKDRSRLMATLVCVLTLTSNLSFFI